ncbi:hepatocyte growth factor-regulated tyrosine kinase substrate isoform X1 [Maniola hyperantus]|uniref:hepatocyte growth factor-regulated tyrosine kinase substrate isoform X1 n=1 Tax=Aphantopus hyperantus TaxID=2795564 RepID=UPI0015699737|nr:hepatocyte growth factor-regulated tyrosine kinase substrate isoform X1 [Maniola hyperantus]
MFRANNFDKLLDKATSNLRLDPDWPSILQICDLIRQNDCSPKYAVAAIKKKLYSQNPHQAMFALLVLESIVKNCGSGVHDEVASKVFCEMLRDLVKTTQHDNLRTKILDLIQAWAFAFRNNPKYRAVQDTVNILKAEGHKFPPLKESDAMFSADTAPEWANGEVCHRCRVAFSLMVRKHHCRACGQVFCQQCSSKTSTLPKFGIEKEVRVCDACFDKVSRPPSSTAKLDIVDTSNDYGPAAQPQKRPGKTAEELQEEEELQLALALSQSEAEHKEKERKSRPYIAPETSLHPPISPTPSSVSASPEHSTTTNSELSRYLDRNYWEQRLSRDTANAPTAPSSHGTSDIAEQEVAKPSTTKDQDEEAEDKEIEEFVETLKSQVEIFVNRMKSNSSRGRSIANDTSVQTLFMNITAMHSKLLRYIQQQDDKRVYLESLQDKIAQVRDSRAALDTLRAEHAARLAQAAEAAERQRQMQMAAKLQAMRKKKHEYLQYQRQLALQRVQEQEREMQMRQEQQKHQYMMSANSGFYMPGVSMMHYQPTAGGYQNQPPYANPQFHPQMMPQATTDGNVPMPGQPQMSQANLPLNVNQVSHSMPQMTNTYAMATSGMGLSQPPASIQAPMNQPNLRPAMSQQLPHQQQLMMQQMQQMRMPNQPGIHQIMPPNMPNGLPGQNIPQQNQQPNQLPKQNVPNQPQQSPMMPPMTISQPLNQQTNPNNPMYGMQMPNMRMPQMQGSHPNNNQVPVSGYPMNVQNPQNNQQAQMPNMQQMPLPGQTVPLPGQQMGPQMMQGQLPGQNLQLPPGQSQVQGQQMQQQPQMTQGQPMPMPSNPTQSQGQQAMMQGQPMPQGPNMQQPNQQVMNQGQQIPPNMQGNPQGQQMSHHMMAGAPQQVPQMPQQGPAPQQMPNQNQQQGIPQNMQGPPVKVQQNFGNGPPSQQASVQNQLPQPQPTSIKSEHNNNTAELISFD